MASLQTTTLPAAAPDHRGNPRAALWSMLRPVPEPSGLLQLVRELHASLDPGAVVATFAHALRAEFEIESVAFEHPAFAIVVGDTARHNCAFRLRPGGESLGRIRCHRNYPFTQRERGQLARLADLVAHPLRNAVAHAALEQQACEDGLTGLLNRRALDRMLPRELAVAERERRSLSLALLDLDFFKQCNDAWGHAAGDRVLCDLAQALGAVLRQSDLAFRMGGEEFVLLLPDTTTAGAMKVLERVRELLPRVAATRLDCLRPELEQGPTTFSAGVAESMPGVSARDLLGAADAAMYAAKRAGRNRSMPARTI